MNAEPAVDVINLSVQYGRNLILDGVSFRVKEGSVYALLGRNGSGKSSLVRALLGIQRATKGRSVIFGEDSWSHRTRVLARVGFVAEDDDVERGMTVGQLIDFNRAIYPRWNASIIQTKLDLLNIRPSAKFGERSKGQRRQVLLAMALAAEPALLVLDDPTLGLDVVARKVLYDDLLADLADRGTTTLITSHDLAGIEGIADRVGILSGTRLLLDEDLETVKSRFRRIRRARTSIAPRHLEVVRSQRWGEWIEEIVTNYEAPEPDGETSEGVPMSLEEIFMAVTGERES
jgi:ABC-2 type transport system ATP-binding protein